MNRLLKALPILYLVATSVLAGVFSPGLERLTAEMREQESLTVLLALEEQVDLVALDRELRLQRATRAVRHSQVLSVLGDVAESSQSGLRAELVALQDAGLVAGWTSHWLVNGLVVRAPLEVIRELAGRPEVDRAEANLVVELIAPMEVPSPKPDFPGEPSRSGARDDIGITPGLQAIQADRCWYELGVDGAGALVGCLDTGVNGAHEALAGNWRGLTAPAAECWLDRLGGGTVFPEDGHGHGTHVMGTLAGLAENDSIGVAPAAQWIASNAVNQDTGSEFDNDILASLEWFTDPDGDPGTLDDVPDVVQNSWGVNESFAGYYDCDSRWWTAIDACEAAGVMLCWSAGNEGPLSTSLRSPADRAASPTNCFSVGSTHHFEPYDISGFSSRGPSGCGGEFAVKPEVVAPGEDIYSADADGGYTYLDGTSMAGPHVAGVAALMRSADPDIDVAMIKQILMDTATDLGDPGEDNVYGWGLVNAYEAVSAAINGYGSLSGTVSDSSTDELLEGVLVTGPGGRSTTTDAGGAYALFLPAGPQTIDYSVFAYYTHSEELDIPSGGNLVHDAALDPAPLELLYGQVLDPDQLPVADAEVRVLNAPIDPVYTDGLGQYELDLPVGYEYELLATAEGLGEDQQTLFFAASTQLDFHLPVDPRHLPSGPDLYGYYIFDSNDEGGVPFEWNSIAGTGTPLHMGDDELRSLPAGFVFSFYGEDFDSLAVNSNGIIWPGGTGVSAYANGPIPSEEEPNGCVYGHWDDLNPAAGGQIYYQHQPQLGLVVVEFNAVPYYYNEGAVSFQVLLLDPAYYPSMTGDAQWLVIYGGGDRQSCTVGLEDADGEIGLQYVYDGDYDEHASEFDGVGISLLLSTNPHGYPVGEDLLPPCIVHDPLNDSQDTEGPWTVVASISDLSGVASAALEYRMDGGAWNIETMTPLASVYSADIPGPAELGTEIEYRIRAVDASENANESLSPTWSFSILEPAALSYCQDFEGGFDDFTVEVYEPDGNTWEIDQYPGQGNTAHISFSESGQEDHAALISPVFDCGDQSTVELSFWHRLRMGWSTSWTDAWVRGSTDGGLSWPFLLAEWHAFQEPEEILVEGIEEADISSWAAGQSLVRIMFEYHDEFDWYWYVDDVCIEGSLAGGGLDPVQLQILYLGGMIIQLDWESVPGAQAYDVYSANEVWGPWILLATVLETEYFTTVSQADTRGFFHVRARRDDGPHAAQAHIRCIDPEKNRRPPDHEPRP